MAFTVFDTALGPCALAWNGSGVRFMQLPEASREATVARLLAKVPDAGEAASPRTTPSWVKEAVALVKEHLAGRPQDFSRVPLDLGGLPPFTAKVYEALRKIPPGSTISYGELAGVVGSPGASRAIGRAMATNPFPIFVPCQRVLASGGKVGGFSAYGGIATKERLLALEGRVVAKTGSLFDGTAPALPYDPKRATTHLSENDRVLARFIAERPFTLRLEESEGTFAALAESIVYQQLSGKAAATIFGRVRALFPRGRLDPARLLAMPDDELRGAGLSRGKLASLRDLAERAKDGRVPPLSVLQKMDDDAIVERLTEVRGIGRWTVEMLLIFRLGRPDVLPVADLGVRKGFAKLFSKGRLPDAVELERRAERWRPFRSVASWYMWRAAEADA